MIRDRAALAERARNLRGSGCNGILRVRVTLDTGPDPARAFLDADFVHELHLPELATQAATHGPATVFPLYGGHRLRAGPAAGQVKVTAVAAVAGDDRALRLTVEPVGDYSTYTLSVAGSGTVRIDPVFGEIGFRFRPGCFENCPPDWDAPREAKPGPAIDYLARDYESIRHQLVAWMMDRVPGWQLTSEADLDVTLLELLAVAGDELSDYQDRVMNEAYLGTARKRVSLARHARLMDYHVHQGNQARTWLSLDAATGFSGPLGPGFVSRTVGPAGEAGPVAFLAEPALGDVIDDRLNQVPLYTWQHAVPALEAGSTGADLEMGSHTDALDVADLILDGKVKHLLVEEVLNPRTGRVGGRDGTKRQVVELVATSAAALQDPVTGTWMVRVGWRRDDALRTRFCFSTDCGGAWVDGVSAFRGNLVTAVHGEPLLAQFLPPGVAPVAFPPPGAPPQINYEIGLGNEVVCRLPAPFLAWRDTSPGGEVPPRSTLAVEVGVDHWDEVPWLVLSTVDDEAGDHFVVDTDEDGWSVVRFGDGQNGRKVPEGAVVRCWWQAGRGEDGNVGADSLRWFDRGDYPEVAACRNPRDVTGGRAPEPADEIVRRAPEAFRRRQLRAVTLADYVRRAQEVPGVGRAAAAYGWTGSWRTVRVTVDPAGSETLDPALSAAVLRHLDAVRLIGDDVEVRGPDFLPLHLRVSVCVDPGFWPRDVRFLLEQEFSTGFAPDGSPAFFNPDRWSFGQPLRRSEIVGRAQRVAGVHHVAGVEVWRMDGSPATADEVPVGPSQIVRVDNDPDHRERGTLRVLTTGGRG